MCNLLARLIVLYLLLNCLAGYPQDFRAYLSGEVIRQEDPLEINLEVKGFVAGAQVDFPVLPNFTKTHLDSFRISSGQGPVVTYTQAYQAQDTGTFTIAPFSARAAKKDFQTPVFSIKVLSRIPPPPSTQFAATSLDAFLSLELSKETCYLGQQVKIEVRLFVNEKDQANIQVGGLATAGLRERIKNRDFWEEKPARLQDSMHLVTIGPNRYYTEVLYRSFLYPLLLGKQSFEGILLEAQRREVNPEASPLDVLTGKHERLVSLVLIAPEKTLEVLALPQGSGQASLPVGSFGMEAQLEPEVLATGDPLMLKVKITGDGNLALAPGPSFPQKEGIAYFDPQTQYDVVLSDSQALSEKSFTYEWVPAYAGTYQLGPVSYVYFDPIKNRLDSLKIDLPEVRVSGPDRPEILENPLEGFYREGFERASTSDFFQIPAAKYFAGALSLLAAVLFLVAYRRQAPR